MDLVADQYNFGASDDGANGVPALMRMNSRIKDALDPNGILSPGEQGICPNEYRGEGAKGRGRGEDIRRLRKCRSGDGVHETTNGVENGL